MQGSRDLRPKHKLQGYLLYLTRQLTLSHFLSYWGVDANHIQNAIPHGAACDNKDLQRKNMQLKIWGFPSVLVGFWP